MATYNCLYIIFLLTQFYYFGVFVSTNNIYKTNKIDKQLFIIYAIILTLLISTRTSTVGTDTISYVKFFKSYNFYYGGEKTDFMFEMLARFFRQFASSTEWFILWSGTFSICGILFLVYKYSYIKSASLLLFFIGGTVFIFSHIYFAAVRQSCALTFYLMAIALLFDENKKKSRLVLVISLFSAAVLTHGSCAFGIPFIILAYYKPIAKKKIWLMLIISSYVLAGLKISFVNNFLEVIFNIIGNSKYDGYSNVSFGQIDNNNPWLNMYIIPYTLLGFFILRVCEKDELNKWWMQLTLMSIVCTNIFSDNLMWGRLVYCLTIFSILAIPNMIYKYKTSTQMLIYFIFITYFVYKSYSSLINSFAIGRLMNVNSMVPYDSWLFNL